MLRTKHVGLGFTWLQFNEVPAGSVILAFLGLMLIYGEDL